MVRSFVRFSVSPSLAFSATLRVYVWWVVAYLVRHGGAARGLVGRVNAVFSAGVFLRDGSLRVRVRRVFRVEWWLSSWCYLGEVSWYLLKLQTTEKGASVCPLGAKPQHADQQHQQHQQHPRRPQASETPGYYPDGPTRSVHLPQPRGTRALKQLCSEAESVLRVLERSLDQLEGDVGELCDSNVFTLRYLRTASS